jgi:hypothetical protein
MDTKDLFPPSEYLRSEDIEEAGGELSLTITSVSRKEYINEDNGGKAEVKGQLTFAELEKKLALNVTNTNTLSAMFGSRDIDKVWINKIIILFVDPHVKYAGKEVKGIRIRLVDPKQDTITEYWKKSREIGLTREEGLAHLKEFNQDFAAALAGLK